MEEIDVKSASLWLGKLLVEELSYLDAVKGKVEELKTELNVLAAFLEEAVKHNQQDKVQIAVLSQARDVAYDCQDVIETYMLKVAHHEYEEYEDCQLGFVMRWACVLANNPIRLHQISSKIDKLNIRISALQTRMRDYGVRPPKDRPAVGDHPFPELTRIHTHDKEEYEVVGLEHHLDRLVDRLLNPAYSDQTLIAISGMGGIGKSTLAIELYHHPQVREHFEEFALVHLSQQFQTDRILQQLLYLLVLPEKEQRRRVIEEDIKAGRAHGALYQVMKDFKCLVVIDDIWTSSDWAKLQAAFPRRNATGSRILLTTRNEETVSSLDQHMVYLHPIGGLNDDKSWELFEKTAFLGATCTDPKKKELGREMLRHCRGVPLAIIVLGKILRAKVSVNEWKQMCDNISAQIERGGAPNEPYRRVYDVLQVSYDDLQPSYLKYCFLHLANFPEDYEIPAERLFKLWVSEGIIFKEYSHELEEDAAERCLNELVSRNMVQVGKREFSTGRIVTCRLHDLMRDTCIEISKREGFLQVINCEKPMLLTNHNNGCHLLMTSHPERDKRLRRLAVYVNSHPENSALPPATPVLASTKVSRAPNLRSISLFSVGEHPAEEDGEQLVEAICKDFPLLRVFDCENFLIKGKLPKKVGNLIHLRFLGLANTHITELPSSSDKLLLLQTLDLRVNKDMVISLPNLLWKMKQLRHLYLPHYGGLELVEKERLKDAPERYLIEGGAQLRLDGLQNLQTIVHIDLDRVDLRGMPELSSMKTLSASCVTCKEALYPFMQLSSMKKATLRIHGQIINEEPMILSSCKALYDLQIHAQPYVGFTLRRPLCLEMFPKNLVHLSIWYLQLGTDPMPILEKLPNLFTLGLRMCYPGTRMFCTSGGFPELIDLFLDGLFSLSDWDVEEGALLKLTHLQVINCRLPKLPDALPDSLDAAMWNT